MRRAEFQRWQQKADVPDRALCTIAGEIERGLRGVRLGDCVYKKRLARTGAGKRGGYRLIVTSKVGVRHVFLHGFAKCQQADLSDKESKALRFLGKVFLRMSERELSEATRLGVLMEVRCGEQDH